MKNSEYLIDLKISGEDLTHVDKLIKYIASPPSTRNHIIKFNKLIEKELFKNEYYIIDYYIQFMSEIKNLSRLDLGVMKRLIALDREMFVDNPNVEFSSVAVITDDKAGLIEQIVVDKIDEILKIQEPTEEEFNLSYSMLTEVIRDLKVQNLIYASSKIFFDGKKIGRELYKGREGYIKFMEQGLLNISKLSDEEEDIARVDKEYILLSKSSNEELFDPPLETLKKSWGKIKEGDSISIIAIQNVGKTTVTLNYLAESIMAGVNSALFISEMSFTRVMARVISIIGARKYGIKLPSGIVSRYLDIEKRKFKGESITEVDKAFISNNEQKVNNVEYILNALTSENNKELGTLYNKKELTIETLPIEFESMRREYNIQFIVIDHVNGIRSKYGMKDMERIDSAYKLINSLGKKYGIANLITNHIPEDLKIKVLDKNADLSNVRGAWSTESTRSPDYVIILDASMEQKSRGEFAVMTNKDRNSNTFFEPFLTGIHTDVGMIYEVEVE